MKSLLLFGLLVSFTTPALADAPWHLQLTPSVAQNAQSYPCKKAAVAAVENELKQFPAGIHRPGLVTGLQTFFNGPVNVIVLTVQGGETQHWAVPFKPVFSVDVPCQVGTPVMAAEDDSRGGGGVSIHN